MIDFIINNILCLIKKRKPYKIIPLGTYCFPRTITTISWLKPRKILGEKSCPFDLAFFRDLKIVHNLISNKFKDFYKDLKYNPETKNWENRTLCAEFNHDGKLNKQEFEKRYNERINNFYNFINNEKYYKFFLIAIREKTEVQNFINIEKTINLLIPNNQYQIIIINQSKEKLQLSNNNISIIDQSHNFENFQKIDRNNQWSKYIKKRNTPEAKIIYSEIVTELKNIIKTHTTI